MLLRSRLKKELVNLLISKNKKICVVSLVFVLGLALILKQEKDEPEDKYLSSGHSVIRGNMVKIDNYKNAKKYLKNTNFYFLEHMDIVEEEQYPQGICLTDEFLIVSSYAGKHGELGKLKIFDKKSGEYLLTLEMDEKSHLGGVAYDGTYVWVCNSSKMALECIEYSFIKQMIVQYKGASLDIRNLVERYRVKNIPSSVTCYEGTIWVATHSVWSKSIMCGYRLTEHQDRLQAVVTVVIPPKVQGIAFAENGEVYLSTSYGRRKSSYIKKYDSIYSLINHVNNYSECIELPPCSEGIAYEENRLFVVFESAGTKYLDGTDGKGKSKAPLDKILVIPQ